MTDLQGLCHSDAALSLRAHYRTLANMPEFVVAQVNRGAAPPARANRSGYSTPTGGDVLGGEAPATLGGSGAGARGATNNEAGSLPEGTYDRLSGGIARASGENPPAEMAAQVRGSHDLSSLQP